jgi:hypothetical protein
MGLDVERLEPWQFLAAWTGWREANSPPQGPGAPSEDEFRQAVARDAARSARTVH